MKILIITFVFLTGCSFGASDNEQLEIKNRLKKIEYELFQKGGPCDLYKKNGESGQCSVYYASLSSTSALCACLYKDEK